MRDLGSLPVAGGGQVRRGRLFRGASLHRLTGADKEAVEALGFRLAIDLRSGEEVARGTYESEATSTRHLPIFEVGPRFETPVEDVVATLADTYMWMLGEGGPSIAAILALLCDPDSYPAVVYCAAGKDRTGTVCALVLSLVGVEPEAIVADYARSEAPAAALRKWRAELAPDRRDPVPAEIWLAPSAAMASFLAQVDERHGSLAGYLEDLGVDVPATRVALRRNLLDLPPNDW